jgi:uncharacterized damage-inducible protein DinB
MAALERMFFYNAWANERIFAVATQLDADRLLAPIEGIYGSVLITARHLLNVEENYLRMVSGTEPAWPDEHDIATVRARLADAGTGFATFIAGLGAADLARTFRIPWFEREFTIEDGLLQAVTHSIEHRADLASAITRLGMETPPIDYIAWVMAAPAR